MPETTRPTRADMRKWIIRALKTFQLNPEDRAMLEAMMEELS